MFPMKNEGALNVSSNRIEFGHAFCRYNFATSCYKSIGEMHFKFNQIAFVCTRKMKQRIMSHFHYFVFVFLLSFGLSSSFTWVPNPFRTQYVRIVNNLNNELLDCHCKSADNDLGLKTLQPKGEWEFSFRPKFQGTTLFYCYFFYGASMPLLMYMLQPISGNGLVVETIAFGLYKMMDFTYTKYKRMRMWRSMIGKKIYECDQNFTYQNK